MRVPLSVRTSDLPKRAASAVVMLAVSGLALWVGGAVWTLFVAAVAIGVFFEWTVLTFLFTDKGLPRLAWRVSGMVYCAIAAVMLVLLRDGPDGLFAILMAVGAVIGTDVGAYFAGRTIGGPKIAPLISPSKTWAGLGGGMLGATVVLLAIGAGREGIGLSVPLLILAGVLTAIVAQAGDFFESWMKRRAGVKDSGKLIPGHGGLFDRVDGLLAVLFVLGVIFTVSHVV
ncbi:phosphatidate cytidylyltransferase [Novosphingobium marinum]|nr:phosphatidate cytidylyltransferase [Novosphingobium marinum]